MSRSTAKRLERLITTQRRLLERRNEPDLERDNGVYQRYRSPVLSAAHTPLFWRYDLDPTSNPRLLERMGINPVFIPGAIEWNGTIHLVCRVEGADRKSFFGVAESPTGIDQFRFWDYPILLEPAEEPDVNVYDMCLTHHEDGWIYGLFCTERKDSKAPPEDTSSAVAQCGIVRTRDLKTWERLADLRTGSARPRRGG